MALPVTSHPSLIFKNPNTRTLRFFAPKAPCLPFFLLSSSNPRFSSNRFYSAYSSGNPDPFSSKPPTSSGKKFNADPPKDEDERGKPISDEKLDGTVVDEWGEKTQPETEPLTKLSDADPPKDEDEWGGVDVQEDFVLSGNGSAATTVVDDKLADLKRCLVDTVYGTDFGFRASVEVRAEALELVNQLEAANPTPAPTEATELLDGNWVLLYTAFSELLPLLAVGAIPLLKVENICQAINTSSLTIKNSTTLLSPFASFSFSASANFEVRSPSRIQVEFKEGVLRPPEIKSSLDLPENVDVFGQKISLMPVQQSLNPLQEAVANIARAISGQPPVKVPIPGERTKSWLLTTYLDKDLRISRGDGGLFVLAKEGSPLLDQ
ncbi:hypothetical protein F0562_007701 [Nyssa sinensis]|uniref:Plastid lipid-associated protein/fibrillin conserved domain-containing protein n=1 Tax=Nyssa sinensis TaxID=561372 RepID=A0A5J5A7P0_9ASTE|nr:hypothetical protein F0562_007701 [Nyssa sinensis]